MIEKFSPVLAHAFAASDENRSSSPATSPAFTECFDILSPPPGDSDVTSQIERLSSNEMKTAPSWVRIAVCSATQGWIAFTVRLQRVEGWQSHSARERIAIHPHGIYYDGKEILACEQNGVTAYVPRFSTSNAKAEGRYGKQDFVYKADEDVYLCPAGERLTYRFTNEEDGKVMRNYWATACTACPLKEKCTTGRERRVKRWEHEAVLEAAQDRLDRNPDIMTVRRSTVEHPFGTLKFWMGSAHFLMKRLHNVKTEMSLHVLSYNMKRVMNILGVPGLLQAMRAYAKKGGLLFIFACAAALIAALSAVLCARQARFQPG